MSRYRTYICGPSDCPNDAAFEHDNYFGCIPKDFNGRTGRSKTKRQTKVGDRYRWNGGCDAKQYRATELDARAVRAEAPVVAQE